MRRMTLLTSLIMVFTLITATAAIADSGSSADDISKNAESVMTQTQERARVQNQEPSCRVGDPDTGCEAAQTRTQTREETQVREHQGECFDTLEECEADQERLQTRDRDQIRQNDGEGTQTRTQVREETQTRVFDGNCADTGGEREPLREMTRAEVRERMMERLVALAEGSDEGEYLRAVVRWMWTHVYGPVSALFL